MSPKRKGVPANGKKAASPPKKTKDEKSEETPKHFESENATQEQSTEIEADLIRTDELERDSEEADIRSDQASADIGSMSANLHWFLACKRSDEGISVRHGPCLQYA